MAWQLNGGLGLTVYRVEDLSIQDFGLGVHKSSAFGLGGRGLSMVLG